MFIELYIFSGRLESLLSPPAIDTLALLRLTRPGSAGACTRACHQMVFITCFVLTSIQYEWKSIFHLDLIVCVLWQLKAARPRGWTPLRVTATQTPADPPCCCILHLITLVQSPLRPGQGFVELVLQTLEAGMHCCDLCEGFRAGRTHTVHFDACSYYLTNSGQLNRTCTCSAFTMHPLCICIGSAALA